MYLASPAVNWIRLSIGIVKLKQTLQTKENVFKPIAMTGFMPPMGKTTPPPNPPDLQESEVVQAANQS